MTATKTTKVTVKPMSKSGKEVKCEIGGADVWDDAIFVDRSIGTDVTFELVPGPAGTLTFDSGKPFCNSKKNCPPELPGGNANSPFSVTTKGTSSITVRSDKTPNKGVSHYRLNFADGSSYDPIIIHD